jgi:hypothetical protein
MGSGMSKVELLEEIRLYGQMMIPRPWWKMAEELAAEKKISLDPPASRIVVEGSNLIV